MKLLPLLLLASSLLSTTAFAANDPRIREIGYNPRTVTTLRGCAGYQSTLAFAPGEQIENVALGNASVWQAVPNKRSDLLFLKPLLHAGHTNMAVVTDRRRYAFDLIAGDGAACRAGHATYDLQFTYPPDPAPLLAPVAAAAVSLPPPPPSPDADMPAPGQRNAAYSFTGTSTNVPMRVFDDGHSTWMRWADNSATPAVYSLGPDRPDRSETLLNYTVKGDYLVVDGISPAFVLRRGRAVAVLYNDAYQQPRLDADAPRPRNAKESKDRHQRRLAALDAAVAPSSNAKVAP
jgi:type IV secretion system protein VirB9